MFLLAVVCLPLVIIRVYNHIVWHNAVVFTQGVNVVVEDMKYIQLACVF